MKLLIGALVAVILIFTAIAYVRARDDDYLAAARFKALNKRVKALSNSVAEFRGDVVKDFSGTDAGIATAANRTMAVLNDAVRKQAMLIEGTIGRNKRASVVLGRLLSKETKSLEKLMQTFDLENKTEILRVLREMEGRHVELVRYLSGGDMDRAVQDLLLRLSKDPAALSMNARENFNPKEIDDSLQQYGVQLSPAELDKLGLDLQADVASGVDLKSALYLRMSQIEPIMNTVQARAEYQTVATGQAETDAFDALVRSNIAHREAIKMSLSEQHSLTDEMSVKATDTLHAAATKSLATTEALLADQRDTLKVEVLKSLEKVQDMSDALAQVDAMDAATKQQLEARAKLMAQLKAEAEAVRLKAWQDAEDKRLAVEAAIRKAKQDEENRVREAQERIRAEAEAQARALETRLRVEAEVREKARLKAVAEEAARQKAIADEAARQKAIAEEAARQKEAARRKAIAEEGFAWVDAPAILNLEFGWNHETAYIGQMKYAPTARPEMKPDETFGMTPFQHPNGAFYMKGVCSKEPGTYATVVRAFVNGVDMGTRPLKITVVPPLTAVTIRTDRAPDAKQYEPYSFNVESDATSIEVSPVQPRFLYVDAKNVVSGRIMESGPQSITVKANKDNGVRRAVTTRTFRIQVQPFVAPTFNRPPLVQLFADDLNMSNDQQIAQWGPFKHSESEVPVFRTENGIKSVFFPTGSSQMKWISGNMMDSRHGFTMAVRLKGLNNPGTGDRASGWFYNIGTERHGRWDLNWPWVEFMQAENHSRVFINNTPYRVRMMWQRSGDQNQWNTIVFRYMPWMGVIVTNVSPDAAMPQAGQGHDGSWEHGYGREDWKKVIYPPTNVNHDGQPNLLGTIHMLGSCNVWGGRSAPTHFNRVVLYDYALSDAQVSNLFRTGFRAI